MLVFISGGVRSGKSSLGEKLAVSLAGENRKIYLATARHYDDEITKRIQVHQQNRTGKNFLTIDKSWDIGSVVTALDVNDTVIVDCLGTLLANEMFERPERTSSKSSFEPNNSKQLTLEISTEKILADLYRIYDRVSNLIVVSNEVFSDGIQYPNPTETYIHTLAQLHIKLVEASDTAIECMYSGYLCHKGNNTTLKLSLI
ncbi:MAG: hypothetical protein APF84_07610 [Gracilibacter sp. BRH_c7a]|nr:MAG: hypothetical protein APF84_19115 [Gracilibacter sp. BRH_c7a]KUO65093.1 MAG: hypothetical protein APF84_07610 [Gracilibacter sp. BRH_c7a]